MANKALLQRALSVTAKRKTQSAEASPPAADAETASADASLVPATPSVANNPPRFPASQAAPRTGPGSALRFMTEQSAVHQEVQVLRDKVQAFEGAKPVRNLDPRTIAPSAWANRDASHFDTQEYLGLQQEVAAAGGNVQPIKVRRLKAPRGEYLYEIVFGHRRHRACLDLGLPVAAIIEDELSDEQLFTEMERENRNRQDLSAWEQGVMYQRALEKGLFPSTRRLCDAIERDIGYVSRAISLSKLPSDVIQAFGQPQNLQFRWAAALKDAHQRDPEALLKEARRIAALPERPAPAKIFTMLTSTAQARKTTTYAHEWLDSEGQRVASMTVDKKGRVTLSFDKPLDEARRKKLVKLLDGFMSAA